MGIWANIMLASAMASVVHELGHFAAAWLLRVEIVALTFFGGRPVIKWRFKGKPWPLIDIGWLPWGGYTYAPTNDLCKEITIVAAGPFANIATTIALLISGSGGILHTIALVNGFMFISAMLPLGQKDGARILAILKDLKNRKWN